MGEAELQQVSDLGYGHAGSKYGGREHVLMKSLYGLCGWRVVLAKVYINRAFTSWEVMMSPGANLLQ